MVKAWFMDEDTLSDRKLLHQEEPPRFVSLDILAKLGVKYWQIQSEKQLQEILAELGYDYSDEVTISKNTLPNYENMLDTFYEEHLHTDPESRLIVEGSGFFDVRTPDSDEWVRVMVEPGEMISIPAGIFHRFSPDSREFVKARRFFAGAPVWTPHNRADGVHPAYYEYCRTVQEA